MSPEPGSQPDPPAAIQPDARETRKFDPKLIIALVGIALAIPGAAVAVITLTRGTAVVGSSAAHSAISDSRERILLSPSGKLTLSGGVEFKGESSAWRYEVHGAPGQVVVWLLRVADTNADIKYMNVIVRDVLPPHATVIPGSVRLVSTRGDVTQQDSPLFRGGFNVGNFLPGGGEYLIWDARLDDDFRGCAVTIENYAHVRADGFPERGRQAATLVDIGKSKC